MRPRNLRRAPSALRMSSSVSPQTQSTPGGQQVPADDAAQPVFEELALLAPTIIPDDPRTVIRFGDSASKILDNSALVIERKIEMLNIFLVSSISGHELTEGLRTMQSIRHHESKRRTRWVSNTVTW